MTFPFGSEFTVGIEEELFLVDETTLALAPMTDAILDAMRVDPHSAGARRVRGAARAPLACLARPLRTRWSPSPGYVRR